MEIKLFLFLLIYFLIGGVFMVFVNKNKDAQFQRNNWIKYIVYFVLLVLLFGIILIKADWFHYVCAAIVIFGFFEIARLTILTEKTRVGVTSMILYLLVAFVFYQFSQMPARYLFYTLFITTVFDSFSQLTGQLFGKKKIFKNISPNKTLEGIYGGCFVTLLTAVLIRSQLQLSAVKSMLIGIVILIFSITGDLLASYCKRKFEVKDFSNILPGHGGVLDRFDSLFASGAIMFLMDYMYDL